MPEQTTVYLTEDDMERYALETLRWVAQSTRDTEVPEHLEHGAYFAVGRHWLTIHKNNTRITSLGHSILEEAP